MNDNKTDFQNTDILPDRESILEQLSIDPCEIKSINPRSKRRQYRAAINWLTKEYIPKDDSNLEKVRCYLEAFYHFSEVKDWEKASGILGINLQPFDEYLHNQLGNWGYYNQQIELYEILLDEFNFIWQIICLQGLGNANHALGNYEQAIEDWQESLEIAETLGEQIGSKLRKKTKSQMGDKYSHN